MPDDLGPDVARRVDAQSDRLVPEGPAPTGHKLTVVGQDPFQVGWRQGDDQEVLKGHGSPDGEVTAVRGTPYVDVDGPAFWLNADGATAWIQIGGAGGGLPTDWVEWFGAYSAPQGPYAYNVSARAVDWSEDVANVSHGGAIVLSGSQPEVTEDGWYALDTYVLVQATTVGSAWTRALGILLVNRSFATGGDAQDNVFLSQVFGPYVDNDGLAGGNASFSWTGYLLAGDSVRVEALLAADVDPSDTWVIAEAQLRMEKLPM